MSDSKLPWEGGCMCGEIRFRISAPPLLTMACHCTGCQKLSASAYSLTIAVPSAGFAITQGEPVIGGLHGPHRQLYCPQCKNWMFTKAHGLDFLINVRATMLDSHEWVVPFVETYTAEKLSWATTPAKHSFATQPDIEGYAPLVEAFAREGARPAWARGQRASVTIKDRPKPVEMRLRVSEIFRRHAGEWRMVHPHASMAK